MSKHNKKSQSYDSLTIFICLVFGVIWAFVGYMLYNSLTKVLWTPLVIGLYFAGLAVMQILAIQLSGLIRGNCGSGSHLAKSLGLVLAILAAGTVLDFIYEQRITESVLEPTSYIFLIDDSSSNDWNDPANARGDAYMQALRNCDDDFPYAVYTFQHNATLIVPMTTASNEVSIAPMLATTGGTSIMDSLINVLEDIQNGVHADAGKAPRIILISDGEDYSAGISRVHRMCKELNTSICTVGYGDAQGGSLLKSIAQGAYGVSLTIDNVNNLENAMYTAASTVLAEQHNLLNFRDNVKYDLLYVIARVLFVLILGILFLMIKAALTRTNVSTANTLPAHLVLLLISGASLEFGINIFRFPVFFAHIVMCMLFLLTFTVHDNRSGNYAGNYSDPWNPGAAGNQELGTDPFASFGGQTTQKRGKNKKSSGFDSSSNSFGDYNSTDLDF